MSKQMLEKIKNGALAKAGVLNDVAIDQAAALIAQYEAEGVETMRLVFPDQHGILRGKTIVASAFASVFVSGIGMPSTLLLKDTAF